MTSLQQRIDKAEKRLFASESDRVTRLANALATGNFSSRDLDAVYDVINAPMRASVMVAATSRRGQIFVRAPHAAIAKLGLLIAHSCTDPELGIAPTEVIDDCEKVLTIGEHERDPHLLPERDGAKRAHRGLVQRLVNHHGMDALRVEIPAYASNEPTDWPLPAPSPEELKRILCLVKPLAVHADGPVAISSSKEGLESAGPQGRQIHLRWT